MKTRFNKVSGSEAGQYVCTAQNEVGTTTGIAVLNIQSIPVVSITPQGSPIRVRLGQRLRLECGAKGDPTPTVSWKRLRTGFLFNSLDATETQQVAVYEISRVSHQDEGTYSCTGRNDAGLSEERIQVCFIFYFRIICQKSPFAPLVVRVMNVTAYHPMYHPCIILCQSNKTYILSCKLPMIKQFR